MATHDGETTFINDEILRALEQSAIKTSSDKARREEIDARVAAVAGHLISGVRSAVEYRVMSTSLEGLEAERLSARYASAGLLLLAGKRVPNVGHFGTEKIGLGTNVQTATGLFTDVWARLDDVAVNGTAGIDRPRIGEGPLETNPANITEGKVVISAAEANGPSTSALVRHGAWFATVEMPGDYRNRERYTTPASYADVAHTMLLAMEDADLNPQFRTNAYLQRTNLGLYHQAIDVELPVEQINVAAALPNWLQPMLAR